MSDYISRTVFVRDLPGGGRVETNGRDALINGAPATLYMASEILGNPRHYLRDSIGEHIAKLQSGEVAAIVRGPYQGKTVNVFVLAAAWAGEPAAERARWEAWDAALAAQIAAERAAERAHDVGLNEGGEGYNPYRRGSAPTYRGDRARDRRYPRGA